MIATTNSPLPVAAAAAAVAVAAAAVLISAHDLAYSSSDNGESTLF